MADFTIPQNATAPALVTELTLGSGQSVDLSTTTSVVFKMTLIGAVTPTVNRGVTVLDALAGKVEVDWLSGDTAVAGTYNCQFIVTYANGSQEVFPSRSYFTLVVNGAPVSGRTLYDLIRTVSFNAGDLEEGTLTGANSTTSIVDSTRNDPNGWWTGNAIALVGVTANPANVAQEKNIAQWTNDGVFVTNAFPAQPTAGDRYELRRNKFHTRAVIREFLNQAVREIRRLCWVPVDSRIDLGDSSTYKLQKIEYTVPSGMEFVHRVLYLDIAGQPQTTSTALPASGATAAYYYLTDTQAVVEWSGGAWVPSTRIPWVELNYDWWTSNMTGTLLIQEARDYSWSEELGQSPIPDGAPLRFMGSQRPQEFQNETDLNQIEGNYLEVFATARLCLRLARGAQDSADFNTKFQEFYKLEADAFRGTRRGLPGGSRKVR